ncbi:arginine N-succinyltransferase [Marinobacterium arenosum]|uniref:arginine N-succinyltransferase n=1 Tax=Marinobacterium arenosum TaxID=2862496 RepID=UPI001C97658B|nr:arginine N-succinyltransferase [Marinobacterium arenosum]MBY4678962.1 arginine N-succinyltransferase [Marinobacterium arenosum]
MLLIRPSQMSDLDDLMAISHAVGRGMTSMPADEDAWREKLAASERAFSAEGCNDAVSTYFMVLEDSETGKVAGTTAIYTGIGLNKPFYSYKVSTLVSSSNDLEMTRQAKVLSMVNDYTGATEIGSLFLLPEYRQPGVGQFLSRARYLTLADFPERFGELVMAELRGWQDEQGHSPLWEHLGSKFFGIEFQDAVNTAALKGTQFISDLMPKYPIYIDLLPQAAREVIGKPHDSSAPALHMLKKEGFQFTGYVDLFDGGPSVQAPAQEIHTVRDSRTTSCRLSDQVDDGDELFMISNGQLNGYRMTLAPARLDSNGYLLISPETADALRLNGGEQARFIQFRRPASAQATVAA